MSAGRAARWAVALAACGVLAMAGCGGDDTTDEDPIAAAQQRVSDAEDALDEARSAFDEASAAFCEDSTSYVDAVDRYGSVTSDAAVTVGDVTTAGADLEEPREAVRSSADGVVEARDEVAGAEQELAEAEADLAEAQSGTTDPATGTTTTTEPLVPAATVDLVEDAEDDLASAFEGVTPSTPLTDASEQVNAAAFAVEVAWLRLFADAGCLSDEQQEEAVTAVVEYTTAVQTSLQTAGYYDGDVDGVYGPETVDAVEALQTDNDLPVTGLVDRATADSAGRGGGGQRQRGGRRGAHAHRGRAVHPQAGRLLDRRRRRGVDPRADRCPDGVPDRAGRGAHRRRRRCDAERPRAEDRGRPARGRVIRDDNDLGRHDHDGRQLDSTNSALPEFSLRCIVCGHGRRRSPGRRDARAGGHRAR